LQKTHKFVEYDKLHSLVREGSAGKTYKMDSDSRTTFFARTNYHGRQQVFGIKQADRWAHMYVIGKTGTGKSTLLETMIRQDLTRGAGLALLDPHGDLVERVLAALPEERKGDLIHFNVPDSALPLGFNPLERVPPAQRALAASYLLEVFKKLWAQFWGPRSEHILRNAIHALLEQPQATLADVLRLFDDAAYRKTVTDRVANTQVRRFWLKEYESYPARLRADSIAPIQNKIGAFLADTRLNHILTQTKSAFDLRKAMDEGNILLVNLAKGKVGEDTASLLGALLVTRFAVLALSRADTPESKRRPFYIYLDEFHTFTTLSIASMLSELRKYRVGLILAHQYISQLDEKVYDAILGNVGTIVSFRLGAADAEILEKEFLPEVTALDLTSLPNYHIFLKLMANGRITRPFSAETWRV
jgi:Type IV secretory pathway, VirD4 components